MLQGPLGFVPVTGRVCTQISYSYRSTVHDTVLPSSIPAPQVSYIPLASDLPVFTGHPVSVSGSETYKELWTNIKMVTIKNTSYDEKIVTIGYRTSGTSYSNLSLTLSPESHYALLTSNGLTTTGLGLEENLRLHCPTVAGDVFLSKSYFAVVPYRIHRGPLKDMTDFRVVSTNSSLFGEQKYVSTDLNVQMNTYLYQQLSTDNATVAFSRVPSNVEYALTLARPTNDNYGTNDYDIVKHRQFRYPLAFSYLMSVR